MTAPINYRLLHTAAEFFSARCSWRVFFSPKDKAFAARSYLPAIYLNTDARVDNLRSDPRFYQIRQRLLGSRAAREIAAPPLSVISDNTPGNPAMQRLKKTDACAGAVGDKTVNKSSSIGAGSWRFGRSEVDEVLFLV